MPDTFTLDELAAPKKAMLSLDELEGLPPKPIGEQPLSFGGLAQTMALPFQQMGHGIKEAVRGSKAKGANEFIEGAGTILKPFALGAALPAVFAAPLPAAIGLGTGAAGSYAGGGLANLATQNVEDPEVRKLFETGGELAGGLMGGAAGALGSRALGRPTATGLANSALGTTRRARNFGTNPGRAVLQETKGLTPETIAKSATERISKLMPVMERHVELGGPVDLTEPRRIVDEALTEAAKQGSETVYKQLLSMKNSLQGNPVTGMPYPPQVPAREALDILRGFNEEHTRFVPERTTKANTIAKRTGGTLKGKLREASPGSQELASRISNLIPAEQMALKEQNAPGMVETGVNRMTRPTGGLLPALAGFMQGGPVGAGLVMAGQEGLSQPAVKMSLARALWRAIGGERLGVPEMPLGPLLGPMIGPSLPPPPGSP